MRKKRYGIKKRFVEYATSLLLITLLLSSLGVGLYMRWRTRKVLSSSYLALTEQISQSVGEKFRLSDAETEKCILYGEVQKSLETTPLTAEEKNALKKYFDYVDMPQVAEYFYKDNKNNIYTTPYSDATLEDFNKSHLAEALGEEYADTKWLFRKDKLFGTDKMALFIGRKIRSLNFASPPGYLFLKMNDAFLDPVFEKEDEDLRRAVVGMADSEGTIFHLECPEGAQFTEKDRMAICDVASLNHGGVLAKGKAVDSGILCAVRQAETGFAVFALVPEKVVTEEVFGVLIILILLYGVVFAIAIGLSYYAARKFTDPVRIINTSMADFDGSNFDGIPELETSTELDDIGNAYNDLLKRLEALIEEVRNKERALKKSEMNVLMNQINPHFLYNTLDTIYMLERLKRGDAAAKMIEALSNYLRLTLSKGADYITVREEIMNVRSYLDIMKMRDPDLFTYTIECAADKERRTLKLILQPLVENAVKYGFSDIYEGGEIHIHVKTERGALVYEVRNTGTPMTQNVKERINEMAIDNPLEIRTLFKDKKKGYGLSNLITRLHMAYGDNLVFRYETGDNFTLCHIEIREEEKDD